MINENVAKGKWKEIKGSLQKAWGNLTNDELDQAEGDVTRLSGLVQQKYGIKQEEARNKINEIIGGHAEKNIEEEKRKH